MNRIFEDKTSALHHNILFIWCILINLIGFSLFIINENKTIRDFLGLTIILTISLIYFNRKASKIVFNRKYCIIYSASFLKHKYYLDDIKINVRSNKIITIRINRPIIKIPFYSVFLKNEVKEDLIKYIKERDDINSKIF